MGIFDFILAPFQQAGQQTAGQVTAQQPMTSGGQTYGASQLSQPTYQQQAPAPQPVQFNPVGTITSWGSGAINYVGQGITNISSGIQNFIQPVSQPITQSMSAWTQAAGIQGTGPSSLPFTPSPIQSSPVNLGGIIGGAYYTPILMNPIPVTTPSSNFTNPISRTSFETSPYVGGFVPWTDPRTQTLWASEAQAKSTGYGNPVNLPGTIVMVGSQGSYTAGGQWVTNPAQFNAPGADYSGYRNLGIANYLYNTPSSDAGYARDWIGSYAGMQGRGNVPLSLGAQGIGNYGVRNDIWGADLGKVDMLQYNSTNLDAGGNIPKPFLAQGSDRLVGGKIVAGDITSTPFTSLSTTDSTTPTTFFEQTGNWFKNAPILEYFYADGASFAAAHPEEVSRIQSTVQSAPVLSSVYRGGNIFELKTDYENLAVYTEKKIAPQLSEYDKGLTGYNQNLTEYNAGLSGYQGNITKYNSDLASYNSNLSQYNTHLATYNAGRTEAGYNALALEESALRSQQTALNAEMPVSDYASLQAKGSALAAQKQTLDTQKAAIDLAFAPVTSAKQTYETAAGNIMGNINQKEFVTYGAGMFFGNLATGYQTTIETPLKNTIGVNPVSQFISGVVSIPHIGFTTVQAGLIGGEGILRNLPEAPGIAAAGSAMMIKGTYEQAKTNPAGLAGTLVGMYLLGAGVGKGLEASPIKVGSFKYDLTFATKTGEIETKAYSGMVLDTQGMPRSGSLVQKVFGDYGSPYSGKTPIYTTERPTTYNPETQTSVPNVLPSGIKFGAESPSAMLLGKPPLAPGAIDLLGMEPTSGITKFNALKTTEAFQKNPNVIPEIQSFFSIRDITQAKPGVIAIEEPYGSVSPRSFENPATMGKIVEWTNTNSKDVKLYGSLDGRVYGGEYTRSSIGDFDALITAAKAETKATELFKITAESEYTALGNGNLEYIESVTPKGTTVTAIDATTQQPIYQLDIQPSQLTGERLVMTKIGSSEHMLDLHPLHGASPGYNTIPGVDAKAMPIENLIWGKTTIGNPPVGTVVVRQAGAEVIYAADRVKDFVDFTTFGRKAAFDYGKATGIPEGMPKTLKSSSDVLLDKLNEIRVDPRQSYSANKINELLQQTKDPFTQKFYSGVPYDMGYWGKADEMNVGLISGSSILSQTAYKPNGIYGYSQPTQAYAPAPYTPSTSPLYSPAQYTPAPYTPRQYAPSNPSTPTTYNVAPYTPEIYVPRSYTPTAPSTPAPYMVKSYALSVPPTYSPAPYPVPYAPTPYAPTPYTPNTPPPPYSPKIPTPYAPITPPPYAPNIPPAYTPKPPVPPVPFPYPMFAAPGVGQGPFQKKRRAHFTEIFNMGLDYSLKQRSTRQGKSWSSPKKPKSVRKKK